MIELTFWNVAMITAVGSVILAVGYIFVLLAAYIIVDVIDWIHYGRKDG